MMFADAMAEYNTVFCLLPNIPCSQIRFFEIAAFTVPWVIYDINRVIYATHSIVNPFPTNSNCLEAGKLTWTLNLRAFHKFENDYNYYIQKYPTDTLANRVYKPMCVAVTNLFFMQLHAISSLLLWLMLWNIFVIQTKATNNTTLEYVASSMGFFLVIFRAFVEGRLNTHTYTHGGNCCNKRWLLLVLQQRQLCNMAKRVAKLQKQQDTRHKQQTVSADTHSAWSIYDCSIFDL